MAYEERELEDDYPIFPNYLYVADGVPINAPVSSRTTAAHLKRLIGCKVLTKCNIVERGLINRMANYVGPEDGGIQVLSGEDAVNYFDAK